MGTRSCGTGGGKCMIANGICLMGGCFALNEDLSLADGYWPGEYTDIPTSPSSVGLYEHDVVPVGVDMADCRVYTRQVAYANYASFFFVFQNDMAVCNCYVAQSASGPVLEVATNASTLGRVYVSSFPIEVEFCTDENGARCIRPGIQLRPFSWDAALPGARLRLLDARQGKKDFYISYGQWGHKWYLLPMRSVLNTKAVFDFEESVLIEL